LEMQLAASRERMIPFKMMLMQQASGFGLQASGGRSQRAGGGRPSGGMPGGGMPSGGMPGQGMTGGYGNGPGGDFENVDWQNVMATDNRLQASGFRSQDSRSPKPEARSQNVEYRVGPGGNMVRYVDGVPSEARVSSGNNRRDVGDRGSNSGGNNLANSTGLTGIPGMYPASAFPQYAANAATEPAIMEPGQLYSASMLNGGQSEMADTTGMATSGRYSDQTTMRNAMASTQQGGTQQTSPQENWLLAEQAARYHAANGNQQAHELSGRSTGTSESASDPTQSPGMPQMAMSLGNRPPSMPPNAAPPPNWAIADDKQNAMEVTRPIVVECFPNKILIRRASGSGTDREVDIPPGASVHHLTDTLVSQIVTYIDTWGMAARGTYWQPEMIVTVQPGAEARFEELKAVMHNSGVRIRRR